MGTPFKDHQSHSPSYTHSFIKKIIPYFIYVILPIAVIRLYLYSPTLPQSSTLHNHLPQPSTVHHLPDSTTPISITTTTPSSFSSSKHEQQEQRKPEAKETQCDYRDGDWVPDKMGPLYTGTTCGTIKKGQNCIIHGRSDLGYLYWKWKPKQCSLPRFEPNTFLNLLRNKHIAFVGDSMARNQLESLLCMLATASKPKLVYTDGEEGEEGKFRRWNFGSHNVNVSVYWSPFLVRGVEKSKSVDYNQLFLDQVDERWAAEMGKMDMVVLSVGHWFLHPAVYYEGGSALGCHYCPGMNHTEIGFYDILRKAIKTSLKTITERRGGSSENGINVIVTTFSPAHFEGEWDKAGACPKIKPYSKGEKNLEGMDADMRQVEVEEVEAAKVNGKGVLGFKVEELDVTYLSLMRPDGHPGPYMNPFPFADGVKERMQNDCVHWCLPGAIDTWNEIMLEIMKKWNRG